MFLESSKLRVFEYCIVLLTSPVWIALCVFACLLHVLAHRTNPIFMQKRVGQNQKTFTIFKIRTMRIGTPSGPTHSVSGSHVTFLGGVFRKFKIDEFPQLVNVLFGQMGFIGPRPSLPSQAEVISQREKYQVNFLRPGITGISQVSGIDMSDPVKLAESDSAYLSGFTINNYIQILVATVFGRGSKDYTDL